MLAAGKQKKKSNPWKPSPEIRPERISSTRCRRRTQDKQRERIEKKKTDRRQEYMECER
jgi:hypothetical protein